MLHRLFGHMRQNVVAWLALFVALGGTSAWATHETIRSSDIVDGEVKSIDIGQNEVGSADVKDNSLNTFDVHSFLGADVVNGSLTSADVQDETLLGVDINPGSLTGFRIADGSLTSADIANGSLNDEDVGQSSAVNFAADIGIVNATSCVNKAVTGLNASADHLLLTPSTFDAHGALMYDARYNVSTHDVTIHVCNFSNANIDDATTTFNLLVIDAQ
jgi:hypothetical protein